MQSPNSAFERYAVALIRLGVAGVFVYAAWPKLVDSKSFVEALANYRMLPEGTLGWVALLVPCVELICALALVTGVFAQGAALCSAGMLLAFSAGMMQARFRGIDLNCGCFGASVSSPVSWSHIGMNIAGAAVVMVALYRASTTSWTWPRPSRTS